LRSERDGILNAEFCPPGGTAEKDSVLEKWRSYIGGFEQIEELSLHLHRIQRKRQVREIVLGDSYGSQNSLRQHFGLNEEKVIEKLVVRWPKSGILQSFADVPANQIVQITEGYKDLVTKSYTVVPHGFDAEIPV
jgi:hypothetical protein